MGYVFTSEYQSNASRHIGYMSLSGQAPLYLADDWRLVSDSTRRSLRSADLSTCVLTLFDALRQLSGTHYRKLPHRDCVAVFKLRLKIFLFSQAFSSSSAH